MITNRNSLVKYNSTYNRQGGYRLPETWDTELFKEFDVYLDLTIFDNKDQDWNRIEREIHNHFDPIVGAEKVARHFKYFKENF